MLTKMGKVFLLSSYISPRPHAYGLWEFKQLVDWAVGNGYEVVAGGDFNGQHPLWDSSLGRANS